MIKLNNSSGHVLFSNSDWQTLPLDQRQALAANGLAPADPREAALVETLTPGAYTVLVQSQDGVPGVGLFDIYELEGGANEKTRLLNVSTRCLVGTGNEQAVAGTILGDYTKGTDTTRPKRSILMFGRGPGLPPGVPGRLANTHLELHNLAGTVMSANESWKTATASVVSAVDIHAPSDSWTNLHAAVDEITEAQKGDPNPLKDLDSALWPILKSGAYTTVLRSANGTTGIGLIEMYED